MQPFYAIYNKGTTFQYAFNNHNLHPYYIGAEFPIGQHLIAAVNITRAEADELFNELIKSYINHLNIHTKESFEKYENALFNIDEYCIYLRGIVHTLLTMIAEIHPRYKLSSLTKFIEYFTNNEITQLSTVITKINNNPEQTEVKLYLWTLCTKILLDEFLDDIEILKGDIYYICNDSDGYRGLSRLNALDNRRKLFYLNLTFKTSLAKSIGEAENSKILSTGPLGNDDIIHSVFTDTILEAMYYDLFTVLENNMPIKICKNCNTPFIPKGRSDSLYCDRIMPGFKDKCSNIGALITYKNNLSDIEAEFYAARRRYNTRVSRNPLLKTEFEVWKIKAREKLTAYRNNEISADEFKNGFMDDDWTRI